MVKQFISQRNNNYLDRKRKEKKTEGITITLVKIYKTSLENDKWVKYYRTTF
jgi:hypothetical protein